MDYDRILSPEFKAKSFFGRCALFDFALGEHCI